MEPPGIYLAPTNTVNFTLIPGSDNHGDVQRPTAIDYDPVDRMLYWTDVRTSAINRAFLDGTGLVTLVRNVKQSDGIALDVEGRLMYWTDTGNDLIERAMLDGQSRMVILNLTASSGVNVEPRAIVLDLPNRYMYWTDWGSVPKIERANTDGKSPVVLVDTDLIWPNGLALDVPGNRIYWCDAGLDRIETSNLLGQARRILAVLSTYEVHPFDISYYRGSLYWTDWKFTKLHRLNLHNNSVSLIGAPVFQKAGGIHFYEDDFADHSCVDRTPCGTGQRCRQFNNRYQCVCMDGRAGAGCRLRNPCASSPCVNGGTCLTSAIISTGHFCQCPHQYSGVSCEIFGQFRDA